MAFLMITMTILIMLLGFLLVNLLSPSGLTKATQAQRLTGSGKNSSLLLRLAICVLFLLLTGYHLYHHQENSVMWYYPIIVYSFLWNSFLLLASIRYKPYTANQQTEAKLAALHSVVVIPVYNEDQEAFSRTLASIAQQTHLPDVVYIIEDGSKPDYAVTELVHEWRTTVPFKVLYKYVPNAGKRVAQSHAFRDYQDRTDLFLTIDSDTVLDKRAIEESLIPFADEQVMSVAGLLLSMNVDKPLSKLLSVSFPTSFTNGRACASWFNSVSVSCGGLATYRASVIKAHLDHYLNQIVFGQRAMFGDDRMLTHYAALMGKTVYQESSIGYTLMPENLSHLTRQRVRWWKSFWWGGMFLVRQHSPRYMIWWIIVAQYISQVLYAVVFQVILIITPLKNGAFPWVILLYMIGLGVMRSIRLLGIKQADGRAYLPVWRFLIRVSFSTMLNIYLCTLLSYYSFFMMWQVTGWGTRNKVEVSLKKQATVEQATP